MGQRHQIFLKIANPAKHLYTSTPSEKKELEAEFGTGDFAILAYHHQWLYGRSALHTALRVLEFANQFTREAKTSKDYWGAYNCPFSINGMRQNFTKDKLTTAMAFVINFIPKDTGSKEAGFDTAWYLGKDEPEMNFDYTRGDNNDGIMILDLVEMKYCFMNINGKADELKYSATDLPHLKPVSAKDYVACYYGETIETTNPYKFGNHDRSLVTISVAKQQKIVNTHIKDNLKISKQFDKFEVLTKREVDAMFKKKVEQSIVEAVSKVPRATKTKERKKITLR